MKLRMYLRYRLYRLYLKIEINLMYLLSRKYQKYHLYLNFQILLKIHLNRRFR